MGTQKNTFEGYERIKSIGKGAFGTAVLYKRLCDNKDIVIKEIFLSEMTDTEKQLAFNEAKVLASLNHPNIIRYMGSFEKDGSLFIEMEYADNGNLAQLINLRRERQKIFREKDILEILTQITAAITYMHSHKILHRDLKSANIFLNKNGTIKIGDFGISKIMTTRAQAQTVVGTPYYLSPEMCEGKDYDEKSDIWAVGCILYELACFRKPFEAPNLSILVQKISTCEYEEIPDIYSNNLSQLIRDILQKDYTKRPSAQCIHDKRIPNIMQITSLPDEKREKSLNSSTGNSNAGDRSVLYQLIGLGDDIDLLPVELPNKKIISFSRSETHFIVVTFDNLVYTWGKDSYGQLAHGVTDSLITTNITNIKCGSKHVLALTADGKVYSWGSSSDGQLGLGHEKFCYHPTLIKLPTEYLITNVFAELNSSALLDIHGQVLVCGENQYNKLGVKNEKNILTFKILKILKDKITKVSMGINHTILVTQMGKVIGMGNSEEGQLGIGNCTTYSYPQSTLSPPNITMVSCGPTYTVAGTANNVVYIWGTYYKKTDTSEISDKLLDTPPTYAKTESQKKKNVHPEKIPEEKRQTCHTNNIPELIKKPKSILALYASKERLKAGHAIWLDSIYALENSVMVLVHTTAPPPLRKAQSVDSSYTTYNSSNNIPEWMDTNLDYSALTTLPNTPQYV